MNKCKVCKKTIKQAGSGRPRKTHKRCQGAKKTAKSTAKKTAKRTKKGSVRKYSSGSITRSRQGREFTIGSGWLTLHHGGRTGATQHDKIWAIKVVKKGSGWSVVTRHGRRTGEKNETIKKATAFESAQRDALRLLKSKLRKGYIGIGCSLRRLRRLRRGRRA